MANVQKSVADGQDERAAAQLELGREYVKATRELAEGIVATGKMMAVGMIMRGMEDAAVTDTAKAAFFASFAQHMPAP